MDGKVFLMYMVGALFIGMLLGVGIGQPYPVHLEDWEADNYKATITQTEANAEEALADLKRDLKQECDSTLKESTDRLTNRNKDLIELNSKCLDLFEDLNASIVDLNKIVGDMNFDANCWR